MNGAGVKMMKIGTGKLVRPIAVVSMLSAALGLAVSGAPALANAAGLRLAVEEFAGQAVILDPRISVPDCGANFALSWTGGAQTAVMARCAPAGWQLVIPVARQGVAANRPARTQPLVQRGDLVTVSARGPGYAIQIDGVAERAGRPGERMLVRNIRTGARIPVIVQEDGSLMISHAGAMASR